MDAETKLTRARCQLLSTKPFYGELALYLEPVMSTVIDTTATDGRRLYYNPDFVMKHNDADIIFAVEHEVWHCIQGAFDRVPKGCTNMGLLNLAQDFVINTIIHDEGITKSDLLTQLCTKDVQKMARDQTSEHVYFELLKKMPKCQACEQGVPFPNPQTGGQPRQGGGGQEDQQGNTQGQGSGGDQEGEGQEGTQQGQGGGGNQPSHTCHGTCVSTTLPKEGGEGESQEKMSQAQQAEWQQRITNAAEAAMSRGGQGSVPGSIQDMLAELFNPTVRWQDYVTLSSQKAFKERYTWRKASRRQGINPLKMISREPTNKGGVIALDTSGSISDEWIKQFMSEAIEIMECCKAPWIDVYLHDTRCYKKYRVGPGMDDKWRVSRGGTCHLDVFEKILESDDHAGLIICMTDLYTTFPSEAPQCQVIWAHPEDQGNEIDVPFGTKVEVKLGK